ncbi:MAG: hypothetical protein ABFS46_11485 [Myxococcota bacterium]
MARRICLCAGLAASALLLAPLSSPGEEEPKRPTIYKWVDTNGIAHYTTDPDDIPQELRNRLESLRRERRAQPEPTAVDPDDPWREVSVESPDDLWVVRDTVGATQRAEDLSPYGEENGIDPDEEQRQAQLRLLDQQIAELQARIAVDESLLKDWIADPGLDPVGAASDERFREIALRLPHLHGDLAALEAERRTMGGEPEDAAP